MDDLIQKVLNGTGPSDQHLLTLFSVALSMRAKRILELGVLHGASTLPLLQAARLTGGKVISVDRNPTSFVPPPELARYWMFHQADAIEFLEKQSWQIDLVFLDDWHVYQHVKRELELLENLVSPSSIILAHDAMHHNSQPRYNTSTDKPDFRDGGPHRAFSELDRSKWEWATIPRNNGLTIIRKLCAADS